MIKEMYKNNIICSLIVFVFGSILFFSLEYQCGIDPISLARMLIGKNNLIYDSQLLIDLLLLAEALLILYVILNFLGLMIWITKIKCLVNKDKFSIIKEDFENGSKLGYIVVGRKYTYIQSLLAFRFYKNNDLVWINSDFKGPNRIELDRVIIVIILTNNKKMHFHFTCTNTWDLKKVIKNRLQHVLIGEHPDYIDLSMEEKINLSNRRKIEFEILREE